MNMSTPPKIALSPVTTGNTASLNQYFTPRWAAEAIVERHFSDLPHNAMLIEPSCGDGRFLLALPSHVQAIGVEIDPFQAQLARARSGRTVITGDFLKVELPEEVDAIVGNPPFVASTVAAFLERSHRLLRDGGRCGFILPAYVLQTSSKVMAYAKNWSISTELMPRNLFPGLSLPIMFTVFTKDRARKLFGLFLYSEAADIAQLSPQVKQLVNAATARGSVWRQAVHAAFDQLGRETAPLGEIYASVRHRPAANSHCEQQVRKVLQTYPEFVHVERGVWSRCAANSSRLAAAA